MLAISPAFSTAAEPPVTFAAPTASSMPTSAESLSAKMATADFNLDGHADIAAYAGSYITRSKSLAVWISETVGGVTSWNWTPLTPPSVAVFETGEVASAEVNPGTDGDPDLIALSIGAIEGASALGVYLGNGDGTFQNPVETLVPGYPNGMAVADVNGDGIPDVLIPTLVDTGSEWEAEVVTLIGRENGTFAPPIVSPIDSGASYGDVYATDVAVGDFTGSGHTDIAVSQGYSPAKDLYVMAGDGQGEFTTTQSFDLGAGSTGVVSGDFDGNGHADLAVPIGIPDAEHPEFDSGERVATVLGNGNDTFTTLTPETPEWQGENPYSYEIESADLNGDGRPDLLLPVGSDPHTGGVWALLGNGDGSFTEAAKSELEGESVLATTAADFDGDGHPDIAALSQANGDTALELLIYPNTSEPSLTVGSSLEVGVTELGKAGTASLPITDTGNYALSVSSLAVGGADAADFTVAGCTGTIAPGATCDAQVSFKPSRIGAESASVTIATDDPAHPTAAVALSGTGVAAASTGTGSGSGSGTGTTGGGTSKGSGGPGGSTSSTAGKLKLPKAATVAKNGKVALKLTCAGGECRGKLALTIAAKKKVKGKSKTVTTTIGKASYSLAAGKSETVTVKLSAAGLKALAAAPGDKLATKVAVSPAGDAKSTAKLTLKG